MVERHTANDWPTETDRKARRRAAMVDAARALFLEKGYDAVSLAEIVRRSGGSLSTLYELFENKQGLLGAVVAAHKYHGLGQIKALIARDLPPAATLLAIAREVHGQLANPASVGLMRVVFAEGLRSPSFSRLIYESAHLPMLQCLTELFARWQKTGAARIVDPGLAAQMFLGMIVHGAQMRAMFCHDASCVAEDPDATIHIAVDMFARGIGVPEPA